MCHGDGKMRTNNGLVDVWHWKAARGNGVGFADDKHWDTEDRQSDPGVKAYVDNKTADGSKPAFMALRRSGWLTSTSWPQMRQLTGRLGSVRNDGCSHSVAEAVPFDSTDCVHHGQHDSLLHAAARRG